MPIDGDWDVDSVEDGSSAIKLPRYPDHIPRLECTCKHTCEPTFSLLCGCKGCSAEDEFYIAMKE